MFLIKIRFYIKIISQCKFGIYKTKNKRKLEKDKTNQRSLLNKKEKTYKNDQENNSGVLKPKGQETNATSIDQSDKEDSIGTKVD